LSGKYTDYIKRERSLTEKILTVFPGYRGYREKEVLRETDRLVRDNIYNSLRKIKSDYVGVYRTILGSGGELGGKAEKVLMDLDTISERIRHATYGYAPQMNVVQIKEEHIARLIDFDSSLSDIVSKLRITMDNLRNNVSNENTPKLLSDFDGGLRDLDNTFNLRKNCMMGTP
jgi:hypothetical protein